MELRSLKDGEAPDVVFGIPVYQSGDPLEIRGGLWVTLVPEDEDDDRLWEYDLKTGTCLRTK